MYSIGERLWNQLHFADDVALSIKDFALFVNLLASAVVKLALDQLGNRIAVLINDLTLLVDL